MSARAWDRRRAKRRLDRQIDAVLNGLPVPYSPRPGAALNRSFHALADRFRGSRPRAIWIDEHRVP